MQDIQPILNCCCGVDVHKNMIEACIINGTDEAIIIRKQFSTFQSELQEFVLWLYENDCYHIAMESTGVYWIPVYEAIEDFSPYYENIHVINAHHFKNLPGRKTDVQDAEWIATLLRHGLLKGSFVPPRDIRDLREFSREYKNSKSEEVRCKNRIEKFLQHHGFKLSSVLSDITGVSGMGILQALAVKGSLSVYDVKSALRGHTKHSSEEILHAVCGKLNSNECFLLDDYLEQLAHVRKHIDKLVAKMREIADPYSQQIEQLCSIPGIDNVSALLIIAETGVDFERNFKTPGHLSAWAGLKPRNDESAQKFKSRKILPGNPYLKSILVQTAWAAVASRNSSFHKWFWSHQLTLGKKKAIIAVSRKILVLIYILVVRGELYNPDIACAKTN